MFGGQNGAAPNVNVQHPDGEKQDFLKINGIKVREGTTIKSLTGGGGGYGNALERDPQAVREDVIDGYVSADYARSAYGVVLTKELELNHEETQNLRTDM